MVLPASESALTGFVRIINRSGESGSVRVTAIDDTGRRFGPITLNLESNETVNFNSRDLENGNASKGLSGGVGNGQGNWRLEFNTTLDVSTLAYIRTSDGFVTSMHNVAPSTDRNHRVRFFNPGSNNRQVSQLRLTNPGTSTARVEITGRDDAGDTTPGGEVGLTLAAGESRTLTAQALESGGAGLTGNLGDGAGKWQLTVSANRDIDVMSLLQSPTGHLANLSTSPSEDAPASFADAVPLSLEDGMITGQLDSADDADYFRVTVDEPTILDFSASGDVDITVFDEQGNVIAQSSARTSQGQGDVEHALPLAILAGVVVRAGISYTVRIAVSSAARARIAGAVGYQLTKAAARLALRKVRDFVRGSQIKYGTASQSVDLSQSFEGSPNAIVGNVSFAPFSADTPWGSLTLLSFDKTQTMRVGHRPNAECGSGGDYSLDVSIRLALSWSQRVAGKTSSIPLIDFGEVSLSIVSGAPRRILDTAESISVSVATGTSETVRLTDYIEDPEGGRVSFTVSGVPNGWGATIRGENLVVTAREGAMDDSMIVTARDSDRECWNFPLRIIVGEGGGTGNTNCCVATAAGIVGCFCEIGVGCNNPTIENGQSVDSCPAGGVSGPCCFNPTENACFCTEHTAIPGVCEAVEILRTVSVCPTTSARVSGQGKLFPFSARATYLDLPALMVRLSRSGSARESAGDSGIRVPGLQ